jgi:NADH-quinone oxidoreductase subunit N
MQNYTIIQKFGLDAIGLMRHEMIVLVIMLVLIFVKLLSSEKENNRNIIFGINIMLLINLVVGFLPEMSGTIFGGMFHADPTLAMEKNLLNLGTFIIALQAFDWMKNEKNAIEFYFILLGTLLGMFFMISAGHMLMFYIGLELASLPLAALASFNKSEKRSAEAGLKMILMSGFSSCIMLFGISMFYGITGTLLFSGMPAGLTGSELEILAFIFLFGGFAFKISIVPFHLWTADVYEGAPVNITSYLSVISKSAVLFIFITVLYRVFGHMAGIWEKTLLISSVITMAVGNLFALRQTNMKRFLAFSSIAQVGFILLGIIGGNITGMASVVYFLFIYVFSNLGAFGVVSAISEATGKENIDELKGLYKTNPRLSLVLILALLSLAGVPPAAGFFGKFFLLNNVAGQGYYYLVAFAAINMIISLYYYLRIVKNLFIANDSPIPVINGSFLSSVSLVICVIGILVSGFIGNIFEYFNYLSFGI